MNKIASDKDKFGVGINPRDWPIAAAKMQSREYEKAKLTHGVLTTLRLAWRCVSAWKCVSGNYMHAHSFRESVLLIGLLVIWASFPRESVTTQRWSGKTGMRFMRILVIQSTSSTIGSISISGSTNNRPNWAVNHPEFRLQWERAERRTLSDAIVKFPWFRNIGAFRTKC